MMAENQIFGFGAGDVRRIDGVVQYVENSPRYNNRRRKYPISVGGGTVLIEGVLTSTITPPADGRVLPTSFTFKRWTLGDVGGELDESDEDETGYSRSTMMTGSIGAYVILAKINKEWRPIYIDPSC
jgi:hypothetical protein